MLELEKTLLAKEIPPNLNNCKKKEIIDIYIPKNKKHPITRIRKIGNKFRMTKKEPTGNNKSHQNEQTIELTEEEFNALSNANGKKLRKIRYDYDYNGKKAEIDIFKDKLEGLVLVDFEFDSKAELEKFKKPKFCLTDVSQEEFLAGGMLCGKTYEDIKKELEKVGYKKLSI